MRLAVFTLLLAAFAMPALAEPTPAPGAGQAAPAPAAAKPGPRPKTPVRKVVPAKQLFGAAHTPAPLAARAIGFYAKGCLAGAKPLPVDGPAWQAMRLSRNRTWGHPALIRFLEHFAERAKKSGDWPGLLVGDLSQPRGGPMLTGHASHQIGLDADIWLTPMPDRRLSEREREELAATSMLGPDKLSVDPNVWTPAHVKLLKRAASYPEVERILVHPAIKKALCEAAGNDRGWLHKIRPYWGHYYHFHVRIACPPGSVGCTGQPPPPHEDGCGKELEHWLALLKLPAKPDTGKPARAKPPITLDQLPADCKLVLKAGTSAAKASSSAAPVPPAQSVAH